MLEEPVFAWLPVDDAVLFMAVLVSRVFKSSQPSVSESKSHEGRVSKRCTDSVVGTL